MDNINGALAFQSTLDIKDFNVSADAMQQRITQLTDTTVAQSAEMENSILQFSQRGANYITAFLVGNGMKSLLTSVVQVRGQFQQMEIAFETMLGSKSKAHAFMQQMEVTAAKTPFDLQGVAGGAKQLLAYGESADKVNDTLVRLGNIASGLSIPLNDIVYLYGTTMVQGRLYAQDVRQFTGRGIPLVKELAKEYGVTTDEINAMVSAGKIGFPDVQKVIMKMTNEGGQFFNLMEKQSKSLTGMISNLGDTWDQVQDHLGKEHEDFFAGAINGAAFLLDHLEQIIKITESVAIAYGTMKAAIVLNTLATKGYTGVALIDNTVLSAKNLLLTAQANLSGEVAAQTEAMKGAEATHIASLQAELSAEELSTLQKNLRIAAIQQLLTAQQQEYLSNIGLTQSSAGYEAAAMSVLTVEQKSALSKTDLSTKSAAYKAALESEVLAKRNDVEASLAQMRADVQASYAKMEASKQAAVVAQQRVESARYEVYWAQQSGEASAIATAQKKLEVAEDQALIARKSALASSSQFYTAKKNMETAAHDANTAAVKANTITQQADNTVKVAGTGITNTLTVATKNLWKAFKANPLGWIITLAGLAYSAFTLFGKKEDEVSDLTKELTEHTRKATDEYDEQAGKIDALTNQIHDNNLSNEERIKKIKELQKIIPGYNATLSKEGQIIWENKAAIDAYLVSLEKQIKLKAAQEDLEAAYKKKRQLEKQQKTQQKTAADADTRRNTTYNKAGAFIPTPIVGAKESGDAHSALNQTNKDLAEVNKTIEDLNTEIRTNSTVTEKTTHTTSTYAQQVSTVRAQISKLNKEIKDARSGKVKNDNLAGYIANKQKEIQEAQGRLTALTGEKAGKGGGKNTPKKDDKKTFEDTINWYKEQYQLYYQWEQNLGKDVADKKFAKLIKSGTSFLAWVNKNIADLEAKRATNGGTLSNEDNGKLNALMVQRNELTGVKSAMDQFKESVDQSISSAQTLAEKIEAVAKAKQKLQDGGYALTDDDKAGAAMYLADKEKGNDEDVKKMLDSYKDYAQKRADIAKKYDEDISIMQKRRAEADAKGDTAGSEDLSAKIAKATRDKGMDLMGMDLEQLKANPEYVKAFENLNEVSQETLENLIAEFERAKEAAAQTLNPEDLKEFTDTMAAMRDEITSRNPFEALKVSKTELADADAKLAAAEDKARKAAEQFGKGSKEEKAELENVRKAKDKQIKANKKYGDAERKVTSAIGDLCDQLDQVGQTVGGQVGGVMSMIGMIGSVTMSSIQGFQTATKASSKAIQTVEKASVILAIISAAYQVATKIMSLFSGDDGMEAYEDAEKVYDSYISILDDVIDKQKELVATLDAENAKNSLEYAKQLNESAVEAARSLGKQYLDAGASKGFMGIGSKASNGVSQRKGISGEGWDQLNQWAKADGIASNVLNTIKGGRMTGLFDLTVDQMKTLKEKAPVFFANLDSDTQKYLNDIIDSMSTIDELENAWKENLTGVDFDSVQSDFLDMLYDMDAESKDFANSFSDYMRKAMIKQMFQKEYADKLKSWYDQFAAAVDPDGTGGSVITKDEQEPLNTLRDSIINGATDAAKKINEQFAMADENDPDSLEGAIASMSEETGSVIAGRLNAVIINQGDLSSIAREALVYQAATAHNTELIHQEVALLRSDIKELKNNGSLLSQGIV